MQHQFVDRRATKIVDDPFGHAGSNSLSPFGLSYNELIRLVEEGLLRPDFNEWRALSEVIFTHSIPFHVGGGEFFVKKAETVPDDFKWPEDLRVRGPAFTKAGEELSTVVSASVPDEYVAGLAKWLLGKNLELYRVHGKVGDQVIGKRIDVDATP